MIIELFVDSFGGVRHTRERDAGDAVRSQISSDCLS
jgi:hypothetical protein